MKITKKLISIPPYLSTSWANIVSLSVKDKKDLIVCLKDGAKVTVPDLKEAQIENIFSMHLQVLEDEKGKDTAKISPSRDQSGLLSKIGQMIQVDKNMGILPFNIEMEAGASPLEISSMLNHDPTQANMEPLPDEVIDRIGMIGKMLGLEDLNIDIPVHSNCNCLYCQISRAINQQEDKESISEEIIKEEEVSEDDLRFKEWHIEETGENLYRVTNPLNDNEYYNVFLGKPIGCTCGNKNCEHIKAVLQS